MREAEQCRKDERIQLRATSHQERVLDDAAAVAHKNRTDFVLDAAHQEATRVLADQRAFLLGDAERDEFLRLLERTPAIKPRLRELFERGSILVDE